MLRGFDDDYVSPLQKNDILASLSYSKTSLYMQCMFQLEHLLSIETVKLFLLNSGFMF